MLIFSAEPKYETNSTDDISDRNDRLLDNKQIGTKPGYYNLLHFDTSSIVTRKRRRELTISRFAKRRQKSKECFEGSSNFKVDWRTIIDWLAVN